MLKIDAHQHFWQYDPIEYDWISTQMNGIRQDFGPERLQPILQQHGFDGCVAVQARQSEEENKFLLAHAADHGFIKGVVGWVDLRAENIEEQLEYYSSFPPMKGFRHVLQGEADRALMLQPSFMRGIGKLEKWGFTYDILIYADQLQYVPSLLTSFPQQSFVIDHIAKPAIREGALQQWREDIMRVATYDNVQCKISGMVTEADWHQWKKEDFAPYLDTVVEAFGTRRIQYGSDWPVCLVAASYPTMLGIVRDYFSSFSAHEQAQFFGGNATTFYKLS
ncbi:MAG: amidohydrolase family protein [Williamsia sp.]|nr:amidohydrolase family protein [Williamsia sp.]